MSYPEAFAESYDRWSADMTEDVPFYVELAREADGPVVELAVGTGRVAIPVAEAIGRRVIGIDASPAMLEQAREAGGDLLDLRLGDMRELRLEEPAALVDAGVGGARGLVEQGHLAEGLAGAEDGEGLFAHARDLAADADAALEDEVELVPRVAVLKNHGSGRVGLLGRELGDQLERLGFQPGEQVDRS